jgi:hypothetical protein
VVVDVAEDPLRVAALSEECVEGRFDRRGSVLFGYRLQLFALASERGVSEACRLMGVHRSTYYRWKAQVQRSGLEMLRPRERRRPQMPNQLPVEFPRFCGHLTAGPSGLAERMSVDAKDTAVLAGVPR